MHLVIFTDLDGTLLDHDGYSFEAALPALNRIRDHRIPLVFATSKTRPEVEHLQAKMRIREPFIVENGAAVYFPDGYRAFRIDAGSRQPPYSVIQLGVSYDQIRRFFSPLRERFNIRGFGDLSVEEVAHVTGLTAEQAGLAKQREFTEPFLLGDGADLSALRELAAAEGLAITRGGRFFHLVGIRQDKGHAARIMAEIFSRHAGEKVSCIGVGDGDNDIPLLQSVDIPVLIPHRDRLVLNISLPNLRTATLPGSRGWNEIMLQLLDSAADTESRALPTG
jgi:mannosyl-3-phosphoglycerate phosphatase